MGRRICLAGTIVATNLSWAAYAWGGSSSNSESSLGKFYENDAYEWFYGSSNLAMKVEGCVWATSDDNEDLGCMQDSSNDGYTYWYQMAMCRRAQVAYSVYASNSGSPSCSSGNFKGTYVTQDGLSEFIYIMETYDSYSPLSSSSIGDLPICEAGNNGYYVSVGCAADGSFTIDQFSDQYCMQRVSTYKALSDVNSAIKSHLQGCYGIYNSGTDATVSYSTAGALIASSKSCSALDSPICTSTSRINNFGSNRMNSISSASHSLNNFNVANKAKYTLGILCIIGSLFMFLGILFTNRRKRRAMMHRKMRSSRSRRSSSKVRSSSSRQKSSSSASRAKSRTRESSERRSGGEDGDRERSSRSKSRSSRGLTESSGRGERESSGRSSSSRRVAESSSSKRVEDGVFA